MEKKCLVTAVIGDSYKDIFEISGPTIEYYAKKIGADLIVHREQRVAKNICLEKLVFGEFLSIYDRGIWVGCDCVIRKDCPDLFGIVPKCCIGGVNDPFYTNKSWSQCIDEYQKCLDLVAKNYNLDKIKFDGIHFNCDVLVASKMHSNLFSVPNPEIPLNGDQMLLNYRFCESNVGRFTLHHKFNRIYSNQHCGDETIDAYIYHVFFF